MVPLNWRRKVRRQNCFISRHSGITGAGRAQGFQEVVLRCYKVGVEGGLKGAFVRGVTSSVTGGVYGRRLWAALWAEFMGGVYRRAV